MLFNYFALIKIRKTILVVFLDDIQTPWRLALFNKSISSKILNMFSNKQKKKSNNNLFVFYFKRHGVCIKNVLYMH